jgi:hypothetical protein
MRIKSCGRCLGCICTIGPCRLQRSPLPRQWNICRARRCMLILHYCIHWVRGMRGREMQKMEHGADKSAYLLCADDEWSIESAKLQCRPAPLRRTNPTNPIFFWGTGFNLICTSPILLLQSVSLPRFHILKINPFCRRIGLIFFSTYCSIFTKYTILYNIL